MLSGLANNSLGLQLEKLREKQIVFAGEAVLDRYLLGETHWMSPEAPIPVLARMGL